jgi:hypothetical protein
MGMGFSKFSHKSSVFNVFKAIFIRIPYKLNNAHIAIMGIAFMLKIGIETPTLNNIMPINSGI